MLISEGGASGVGRIDNTRDRMDIMLAAFLNIEGTVNNIYTS